MIPKLQALKKLLDNREEGELTISKELYHLLVSEKSNIEELFRLVSLARNNSILRVLLGELVSEQVGEFDIPEKGLSAKTIADIRSYLYHIDRAIEPYDESHGEQIEKNLKLIKSILKRGEDIPKRLDVFLKKPQGKVLVYDILQDCYVNELLKYMSMDGNDEEIFNILAPVSMNIMQVDWLYKTGKLSTMYKTGKLSKSQSYSIFVLIDGKLRYLKIGSNNGKDFYWYLGNPEKDQKLLIFNPLDIDTDEKYFQK